MEPSLPNPEPTPGRRWNRRATVDLLLLLLLGAVVFTAGFGLRDPWPADEPRFALVAQEMVDSGSWLFPRRAGQLYPDKPPLFMWGIALGYKLTGSIRYAFLLPSLLSGFGILTLIYDLARRLWHRRVGLAAGLAALTVVQLPLQAKTAQIDASVTFFITLGLYGVVRHLLLGPSWRWWYIACAAMGFGVITKGVGFLPLLVLLPWAYGKWRGWPSLPRLGGSFWQWAVGPVLMLAAIATWIVPMWWWVSSSGDPDLLAYRNNILWGQTAQRYASFKGHQKPIWYYPVQVIPVLWLPLSFFLPWLIPAWWRRLRRRDGRYLLLLGWIVAVTCFFTLSSGKRGVYLLPAVPAFALCCGPLLAAGIDRLTGLRRTALGFVAFLSSVFLSLAAVSHWRLVPAPSGISWSPAASWLFLLLALAGGSWITLHLRKSRQVSPFNMLTGFMACIWLAYGLGVYPLLNDQRSAKALMQHVAERLEPSTELAAIGWREQMMLQADRPITHWGYNDGNFQRAEVPDHLQMAAAWLRAKPVGQRAAILPAAWMEPCFDADAGIELGRWHRLDLRLVDAAAVRPDCPSGELALPSYRSFR